MAYLQIDKENLDTVQKSTHRNMMICGPLKIGNKIQPQVTQNLIKSVMRNTKRLSPHSKY